MTQNTVKDKQKGAALIISLFMLLILTVLGVTSMRTTILEERMVGNERDRAVALQAAESALRDAESEITALLYRDGFTLPWQKDDPAKEDDPFDSSKWTDAESKTAPNPIITTGGLARLKMTQLNTDNTRDGSLNAFGYDGGAVSPGITNYRVTGRGLGGDVNAEIILQAYVGARIRQ